MSKITKESTIHFIYKSDVYEQFPDEEENRAMFKEHCDINDLPYPDDDDLEEELMDFLYQTNEGYWGDLSMEVALYETKHGQQHYILEGNCGTWQGRVTGYTEATGLMEAFYKGEGDKDIYVKDKQLYVKASHHDGTNYVHIRVLTSMGKKYYANHIDDVNLTDFELFEHLFKSNRLSKEVTMFQEIYGWKD